MIYRRPKNLEEMKRIVEETLKSGKLLYIYSYPCPECEIFEASLEELGIANSDKIVKLDVPADDWAVEYVLEELKVPGSPTVVLPDGSMIDDPDPVEMALKVKKVLKGE